MTMYTPKDAFERLTDEQLKLFTKPDYTHIHPDIKVEGPFRVTFDDIYIDDTFGNVARYDMGIDAAHVADLKYSFSKGVILSAELPVVMKRGTEVKGRRYPFELKYGYGRTAALIELGLKGWFFFTLTLNGKELSQTLWERICLAENEEPVKKPNKEQNIINVLVEQVKRGDCINSEEEITKTASQIAPRRKSESINRIVQSVAKMANTKIRYTYYTESKIKQWVKNHSTETYVFKGEIDPVRKQHGFTAKQGSLIRTYEQAIKHKSLTGLDSYVIMHVGTISKDSPYSQKVKNIVKEYVSIREAHAQVYGKDVDCLHVLGCVPQIVDHQKWNQLVHLNIPKSGYGEGNPLISRILGIVS